ncbi:MAG TPA: hypothetical protein VMG12_08125 [Polyangiaceae bacterium]|nr:hypothetical protein [Polyangiaceae bacterium]
MPVSRAVTWGIDSSRRPASGGTVFWDLLCRTALRGVDVAARIFGLDASEGHVERAELLVSYGITPPAALPSHRFDASRAIDWAGLSEFDRGRVAREMNGTVRR